MENKYLTKVCALLRPPVTKKKSEDKGSPYKTNPISKLRATKSSVKIKKRKQRPHNGDTTYRTHKVR